MRAFPLSTDKAAQFLTDEAAAGWRPQRRTVIYDEVTVTESPEDLAIELNLRRTATLDSGGRYTPVLDRRPQTAHRFSLERVDGEWRIVNPPDALYVSSDFFGDYYSPLSLYFLDLSGDVLVPDPVYLPQGEQLATSLVRGLLEGPPRDLAGQVLTSVPPATRLDVSVPLRSDGVAEVGLTRQALELSGPQRAQLAAQVVWTLWQVPGIVGVRILADGVPLDIPGVDEVQVVTSWSQYAPVDPTVGGEVFALRSGRLVLVSPSSVAPFEGMWTDGRQDLADFDVDNAFQRLGGVTRDRSALVVGPAYGAKQRAPRTLLRDRSGLTDPSWDRTNFLWVVEQRRNGSRMLVASPADGWSSPPTVVEMGRLDDMRVEAFAVSPDGLRFAAVARSIHNRGLGPARVMLGNVHRVGADRRVDRVTGIEELLTAEAVFRTPRDVGWSSALTVAVLARTGTEPLQAYEARIDGSEVTGGVLSPGPPLGPVGATTLAPGRGADSPTYVGTSTGQLWYQDLSQQWVRIGRLPLWRPEYAG